jgi:hypothetical protein
VRRQFGFSTWETVPAEPPPNMPVKLLPTPRAAVTH